MQGDVVKAARWLGGSLVASSLVLVVGFHPSVTSRVVTVNRVQPAADYQPQPFVNTLNESTARVGVVVGLNPAEGGFVPDLNVPIQAGVRGGIR